MNKFGTWTFILRYFDKSKIILHRFRIKNAAIATIAIAFIISYITLLTKMHVRNFVTYLRSKIKIELLCFTV